MAERNLTEVDRVAEVAEGGEIEIDLLELFYRLAENIGKIAVAALLGMVIFAIYSFVLAVPEYEATCRIYVTHNSDSAINLSDFQIGNYLTADYQEVFHTWEVHEQVIQNLGLDYSYEELEGMLEITNPSDTRILDVTVTSNDPKEAMDIANTYAEVACAYISRTMDTDEPSILSKALLPQKPVRPRRVLNIVIGFVIGMLLMTAVLTVQFMMDDRIKTSDDIRKYADMAALAVVPTNSNAERSERRSSDGKKRRRYE